jgi:hypothetical protein
LCICPFKCFLPAHSCLSWSSKSTKQFDQLWHHIHPSTKCHIFLIDWCQLPIFFHNSLRHFVDKCSTEDDWPKWWFPKKIIKKISQKLGLSKRLFKSLFCIVLFSLLGFVPNTIYYAIASSLSIPNFWHPESLLGKILLDLSDDLALISCCSNAVILFTFRWEYF